MRAVLKLVAGKISPPAARFLSSQLGPLLFRLLLGGQRDENFPLGLVSGRFPPDQALANMGENTGVSLVVRCGINPIRFENFTDNQGLLTFSLAHDELLQRGRRHQDVRNSAAPEPELHNSVQLGQGGFCAAQRVERVVFNDDEVASRPPLADGAPLNPAGAIYYCYPLDGMWLMLHNPSIYVA